MQNYISHPLYSFFILWSPLFLISHHPALFFSSSCSSFTLSLWKINGQCLMFHPSSLSFSISLIFSPVPHLPTPLCAISSLPLSVLSPPQLLLNTDQPSCLYHQPLHLLTHPPLLSPLPPQTQCHTSAHILPILDFFVLRERGVGQSLGFLFSVLSLILFIPLSVRCLSGAFTCHC